MRPVDKKPPRWEIDAERVRKDGPEWLDMERLPWWSFVLVGLAFAAYAASVLLDRSSARWEQFGAVGVLLMVTPSCFLSAWRKRRGIPLAQPWVRGKL